MIPGWMSSSSTERRRRQAFAAIAEARDEVIEHGRAVTAPTAQDSFYTTPHEVPILSSFDDGVAPALRRHLDGQGLTTLARSVDHLEALGQRLAGPSQRSDEVSEIVYEMF